MQILNELLVHLFRTCSDPHEPKLFYEQTEDADKSFKEFEDALEHTNLSRNEINNLDVLATCYSVCHEEQGFINGFRYGYMAALKLKEMLAEIEKTFREGVEDEAAGKT